MTNIEEVHHWARMARQADSDYQYMVYTTLAENEQAYREMGEL